MKLHPENRLAVGIAAGVVLVGLILVLASGGGSPDQLPLVADTTSPTTESVTVTSADSASPPEGRLLAPLDCFSLLPDDAVDVALGVWDRPEDERGSTGRGKGETCVKRLVADEDVLVGLEPGGPGDFVPGSELIGVTGEPVSGVGDVARWFGGTGAESGDVGGILSVSQETPYGFLYFRIALGRPDLDSAAQQEVAKSFALAVLPRFPGVEPPPPSTRVIPPPEPVDTSSHGYAENLLEREADGEWTRGEGLVATLRLLVGEAEPSEVLRHPELLDFGTGVVSMAHQYLEDGDDPAARSEIERLLAVLVQHPTRSEMVGVSPPFVGDDPTAQSEITGVLAVHAGQPVRSETVATADRLMTPILAQEGEEECLPYLEQGNCWAWVDIEPEKYGEGTYRLMGPSFGGDHGWRGSHVNLLERAMIKTIGKLDELGIRPPHVLLIMTPHPGLGATVEGGPDWCVASVDTGLQQIAAIREDQAEQAAALLIAQCSLKSSHFPDGSFAHETWHYAGAWFLSDVVYPDAQLEQALTLPSALADVETTRSMLDYERPNWAFLEDVGSITTALDLLRTSAGGLGSFPGIDDLIHQYAKNLTAGQIADQGKPHDYTPPTQTVSLSNVESLTFGIKAFRPLRMEVSVDGGDYACVSFPKPDYVVSWSPGSVGSATSWSDELPETLDGKAVFIGTFTVDTEFVLNVSKFVEDPEDCEDDENLDESPDLPEFLDLCDFCDPTAFLHKLPAGLG